MAEVAQTLPVIFSYDEKQDIIIVEGEHSKEIRVRELLKQFTDAVTPYIGLEALGRVRSAYREKIFYTASQSINSELAFHVNPESFDDIYNDHSVIAMLAALEFAENLVDTNLRIPLFSLVESDKISIIELTKEEVKELIIITFIFHDVGFMHRYKSNEMEGAKVAVQWMSKIKSVNSKADFYDWNKIQLVFMGIAVTDVHEQVILQEKKPRDKEDDLISRFAKPMNIKMGFTDNPRRYILNINPFTAIIAAADFFAYVNSLRGSLFLNNYLFRLECQLNTTSRMFRESLKWRSFEWVEKAEKFYNSFLPEYQNALVYNFILGAKDSEPKMKFINDKFSEVYRLLASKEIWRITFDTLDRIEGNLGVEILLKLISSVQTENIHLFEYLLNEFRFYRVDFQNIWNTIDAKIKRARHRTNGIDLSSKTL